jgi:hypothetical protein
MGVFGHGVNSEVSIHTLPQESLLRVLCCCANRRMHAINSLLTK